MDDMVDLELEKVKSILAKIDTDPEPDHVKHIERELWQKIYRMGEQGRRTGLGITALGDVIAAMGMRYGSVESIAFTDEAYRHLAIGAYKSSIDMAEERGAFPLWDYEREKDHSFIKRIIAQLPTEYQQRYKEHGRRNIACTTTAPTGSVSVLTQTTSGIEPAFMTSYTRRRKINPSEEGQLSVDFVDDLGDNWHEYTVYHHWYKRWIDITGGRIFSADPYDKSMANDVDWEASVDIQAAAQKWICHSISKTCNLPKDVDVDLVDRVYMKAWETGCKGFTVYRDGSRTGVLVTENEQAKERGEDFIDVRNAPKRPDELDCDIHHAQIRGEKWTIIVGLMNGRPYEILGGLTEKIELPRKYKVGRVKKRPRKTRNSIYDLYAGEGDDQFVIKDLVDTFHNPNHTAFTRTISLSLRHGVPTNYLVEQLQKDRDADLFSFSKVIARVLKKYIEDGTKAGNMLIEGCSKPGECSLTYIEGCISCTTCGVSRCG
jgi:ribonucleoside-diphosphate reductase alpha chain